MIGPIVIGQRGPMCCASRPIRADSTSITAVTGSSAEPAATGENPETRCSCTGIRKSRAGQRGVHDEGHQRSSAAKSRDANSDSGIIGDVLRASTTTNPTSSAAPTTRQPIKAAPPAPLRALGQRVHHAREPERGEHDPGDVQPTGRLLVARLRHVARRQPDDDHGERQVDQEDQPPPPRRDADEHAAEHRADRRGDAAQPGPRTDRGGPVLRAGTPPPGWPASRA